MAKGEKVIKIVEKALKRGFASKGASADIFTEKSDYKDFVRLLVISDFFRGKSTKMRLHGVFSMLEENGAEAAIIKISLCVAMTRPEYKRGFGNYVWLGRAASVYGRARRKLRPSRRSGANRKSISGKRG
jgi:hypothetical protein